MDFTYFFNKIVAAELILGTTKHDVVDAKICSRRCRLRKCLVIASNSYFTVSFYPTKTLKPYVEQDLITLFLWSKIWRCKDVKYDNALGFVLQGGVDYMLTDKITLKL